MLRCKTQQDFVSIIGMGFSHPWQHVVNHTLNLRNTTLCNATPSLIPWNPREHNVLSWNLPPRCHISLPHTHTLWHQSKPPNDSNHKLARTRHIAIIVNTATQTSCYSAMSHGTLIIYDHTSMLALHTSLISRALWYATGVILGRRGVSLKHCTL